MLQKSLRLTSEPNNDLLGFEDVIGMEGSTEGHTIPSMYFQGVYFGSTRGGDAERE